MRQLSTANIDTHLLPILVPPRHVPNIGVVVLRGKTFSGGVVDSDGVVA
jgi:hypothetical protein